MKCCCLGIVDQLRRSFARFKSPTGRTRCGELGAHLLDLCCLLFNGGPKLFQLGKLIVGPWEREGGYFEHLLIQIVHFRESNTSGVVHATYNRGVIAGCNVAMIADSVG